MKFRVRKPGARYRYKRMWHRWFAWRPVRVPTKGRMSGQSIVWLEWVEQKGTYVFCECGCDWNYKYRYPTTRLTRGLTPVSCNP